VAAQHTGFDPKNDTSGEPPPKKDPRLMRARRQGRCAAERGASTRRLIARKKQRELDDADLERRRASYDRAVKDLFEGRNYSVN